MEEHTLHMEWVLGRSYFYRHHNLLKRSEGKKPRWRH